MHPRSTAATLACATLLLAAAPAGAEDTDDAEKIGIAAALGLTAADGKTTLGAQAGAIEASLLESQATNHAGAIIAALTAQAVPSGNVVLVNRTDTVNAAAYYVVKGRIATLLDTVGAYQCPPIPKPDKGDEKGDDKAAGGGGEFAGLLRTLAGQKVKPSVGDIVPALATSTSFAAVTLSVEDRAIMTSILLNGASRFASPAPAATFPARWQKPVWGSTANALSFKIPAELQGDLANSTIFNGYLALRKKANELRHCTGRDDTAAAAVSALDAYASALDTPSDKAPVAPLALAIQQEQLFAAGAPNILRVAVEQSGGTSRASSNIWYTLGFPGASTISAGLLISFRLTQSATGKTLKAGFVRCAVPPASLRSIRKFAVSDDEVDAEATRTGHQPKTLACSYLAS